MISLPDRTLSKYFTLKDLTRTDYREVDNTPNDNQISNLTSLASILDQLYDELGAFDVESGFRSQELNDMVGGAVGSFHTKGYAADISPNWMSIEDYFIAIITSRFRYQLGEIILEPAQNIVHVTVPAEGKVGEIMVRDDYGYRTLNSDEIAQMTSEVQEAILPSVVTSKNGLYFLAIAIGLSAFILLKRRIKS